MKERPAAPLSVTASAPTDRAFAAPIDPASQELEHWGPNLRWLLFASRTVNRPADAAS
jgi:hypothetical protein